MIDFKVFLKGKPVTLNINKVNIPEYCVTRNINTSYTYHSNVCPIAQIWKKWCQYAIKYIDDISIKVTVSETSQVISSVSVNVPRHALVVSTRQLA